MTIICVLGFEKYTRFSNCKGNPSKISIIGGKTRVAETKVQRIIFPHRFQSQRKTSKSTQFYIQLNRLNLSSSPYCH
jgi:hypothetical protein